MFSRSIRLARPAYRFISTSRVLANKPPAPVAPHTAQTLAEVTGPDASLIGKGAQPGTIPTNIDQATGLERLELLGELEGIDVFDMDTPITEGSGSPQDPYLVPTYLGSRYVGCKGKEGNDHNPMWMKVEVGKNARCWECGTTFKAKYLGEDAMNAH